MTAPVTDFQIRRALSMRGDGLKTEAIAAELGLHHSTVCRILERELPLAERAALFRHGRAMGQLSAAAALAERDARLSYSSRDLTAELMGDPPLGRSALDRRAL